MTNIVKVIWWFCLIGLMGLPGWAAQPPRPLPRATPVGKNMFVSVEIPVRLQNQLGLIQKKLPAAEVLLQPREQFHVTLIYLPNLASEQEAAFKLFLKTYFADKKGIELKLSGEIAHGSWSRASDPTYHFDPARLQRDEQLRVGLITNPDFEQWRRDLVNYAKNNGLLPENYAQPFNPHITIGVMKTDQSAQGVEAIKIAKRAYRSYHLTLQVEKTSVEYAVDERYTLKKRTKSRV